MLVKLPLSIKTHQVLNPSIISMITSGSSCSCFTPLVSSSKKTIFVDSHFLCFDGGVVWAMLIFLCCSFLRDLKDPSAVRPPLIIFIPPIALFG